jgi:integrase
MLTLCLSIKTIMVALFGTFHLRPYFKKVEIVRIYKPLCRARDGIKRPTSKYYCAFRDHRDIRRNWPLFRGKRESERFAERIGYLIANCRCNEPLNADMSRWFENVPERLQCLFAVSGLVGRSRVAASQSFETHLDNFKRSLRLKGRTDKHINATAGFINRTLDACGFQSFNDIAMEPVEEYLETLLNRKIGPIGKRTHGAYVKALKQFCTWAERSNLVTISPLRHLASPTVTKDDHRKRRRVLSTDDLIHLFETTKKQPDRFGLTGPPRAMVYRLACETGLRANEIRHLTVSSFDIERCEVSVLAAYTKNKQIAVLPLLPDTLKELKLFLAGKMSGAQVFPLHERTSDMLQADLEAAKIPYTDASGRDFDFHSLRHQFGSLLADSGVHPKTAQTLMRHSSIELTMNIYSHTLTGREKEAVSLLPDLSKKGRKSREAKSAKSTS